MTELRDQKPPWWPDDWEWRREDSWTREKRYREKWPRFCAEVPPELAELLDRTRRGKLDPPSRAAMVRAGLKLYLDAQHPEPPPPINTTAIDLPDDDLEEST